MERGVRRSTPWLTVLFLLAGALVLEAGAKRQWTRFSGSLRHPGTLEGLSGAEVVLHSKTRYADEEGMFRVRIGRKAPGALRTSFTRAGYLPYSTWIPKGGAVTSEVFLFPTEMVEIPSQIGGEGGEGFVHPETFLQHFNLVYRDELQSGGRLQRWVEQPRISIGSHITEPHPYGNGQRASTERVPRSVIRTVRESIRVSLGPLTNGYLSARRIRVREMEPGESTGRTYEELAPRRELRFYISALRDSGGLGLVDGNVIVSGFLSISIEPLLARPNEPNSLVMHEMGHALGMAHPWGGQMVPLCSIMRGMECEVGVLRNITAVDVVTGRLAYSRLPGNDRNDRDPLPGEAVPDRAQGARVTGQGLRVRFFDSGAAIASEEGVEVPRTFR